MNPCNNSYQLMQLDNCHIMPILQEQGFFWVPLGSVYDWSFVSYYENFNQHFFCNYNMKISLFSLIFSAYRIIVAKLFFWVFTILPFMKFLTSFTCWDVLWQQNFFGSVAPFCHKRSPMLLALPILYEKKTILYFSALHFLWG